MAYNDSPDNEFDQEMERILQEHFYAEDSNLRTPNDPWEWLESRMDEPPAPSVFSRWLSILLPVQQRILSPAYAVAVVVVIAVAVAATLWTLSGNGGGESPEALVVVSPTQESGIKQISTAAPAPTSVPHLASDRQDRVTAATAAQITPQGIVSRRGGAGPPGEQGPAGAASSTAAPAPMTVPSAMMQEPTLFPAPAATEAPAAAMAASPTAAPAAIPTVVLETVAEEDVTAGAMRVPQGPAGPEGRQGIPGAAGTQAKVISGGSGAPPDTTFQDYERQPLVAASEDNVSTFSLDTDRTSYHLALGWAREGYEVDPDSVRAEEWLNAFDYQYDLPSDNSSFAITSDLYPHPLDESKRLARIAFQAPELVDDRPLNVTLVLDASGSMADGNRVDIARQAAESILRNLRAEDRIAVVHFTHDVIRRYSVGHSPPDAFQVRDSISQLQPHGTTNVQAGLNMGVQMADKVRDQRPDAYNYVILMSDGVANVDATGPFAILETAYDADARNPLRLITIGVGINNYNDLLLEQLAQHGNGWYRYLDSTEQAQATFARENWLALSIPFADQTRAQVTWDSEVVDQWRIVGYENRVAADHIFTQDRKEFAELYSGAATTVLYEVELTESALSQSIVSLGNVELRWVDPGTGQSRSRSAPLTGSPQGGFEGRNGSLAHFGAVVALSADLYGILPSQTEATHSEVHAGLFTLLEQLRSLGKELGSLEAYSDFHFLLEYMTGHIAERVQPSPRSSYSR